MSVKRRPGRILSTPERKRRRVGEAKKSSMAVLIKNLQKHMDKRFDESKQRLDGLEREEGKRFDETKQRLDGLERDVGKRFDETNQRLDGLERDVGMLLRVNPKASLRQRTKPFLVDAPQVDQVKGGATATWTFLKDENGVFWAVGAAHCGFYHTGNLVTLPMAICELGVKSVHFPPELATDDFNHPKHDFLLVRLQQEVPDYDAKSAVVCDPTKPITPALRSPVCGLSTSGYVSGEHLEYDKTDGTYIFIEDAGEPGHSGTLMFSQDEKELKPFGVYFGTYPPKEKMRTRGRIVPFTKVERRAVQTPQPTEIRVHANRNGQLVRTLFNLERKNNYVTYEEDGERYTGVVIAGKPVLLCGAAVVGNTRRPQEH